MSERGWAEQLGRLSFWIGLWGMLLIVPFAVGIWYVLTRDLPVPDRILPLLVTLMVCPLVAEVISFPIACLWVVFKKLMKPRDSD